MVSKKQMRTTRVAKIPKLLSGMILLETQERKATAEVTEVTNICFEACLYVYEILRIGSCLIAAMQNEFYHESWNTKMSSAPIPTMMIKIDRCMLEK